DEAVDRIVDEVIAKVTEPVNAKLEAMVEDMVLDLAEGAFSMPDSAGGSGGKGGHGGMQIASAGGGGGGTGGGGAEKVTRIDHTEFEGGAGKVAWHGGELRVAASSPLGRARGAFGRSKGRDPFTQAFDSVLHGGLKGTEKALDKVAKHITETIPERTRAASRLHKNT
ncbi:type IV secretion protein Rhs, partial [Streptomyces acidiscabies]|nr:type IV secretion protein Rhs [Streptomyces acidiscabies]